MSISPALTSQSGRLRIAVPIVLALQVSAACEAPGPSDPSKEIQHDPPILIGAEGTEIIAFPRVIFDVPLGAVVGAHYEGLLSVKQSEHTWSPDLAGGNTQPIFAASEELRRLGYSVTGNDEDLLGEDPSSKPRFLLGARIQKVSYDTYGPDAGNCSTAKVLVEWQLFDTAKNAIVFTLPATGGSRLDGTEASAVREAFVSALADLTSNEKFVSLVRKRAPAATPAPNTR
jgi:hypothetical protein